VGEKALLEESFVKAGLAKLWVVGADDMRFPPPGLDDQASVGADFDYDPVLVDLIMIRFTVGSREDILSARARAGCILITRKHDAVAYVVSNGHGKCLRRCCTAAVILYFQHRSTAIGGIA